MVTKRKSVTLAVRFPPSLRHYLRTCALLLLPFLLAGYWLFWFFEGLGSVRTEAIYQWSVEHNVMVSHTEGDFFCSGGFCSEWLLQDKNNYLPVIWRGF